MTHYNRSVDHTITKVAIIDATALLLKVSLWVLTIIFSVFFPDVIKGMIIIIKSDNTKMN